MKKLFLISAGIGFCMLMSCKESTSADNGAASLQEKNKANTMIVYKALETGDVNGLDSIIDKDFVDHSGPNGDVKGIDSLKSMFIEIHNHIPGLKMESIANATDGDYNFDLNRMSGTTSSPYMGMPANYKFDMMSVDVVKIKNGKAIEHWGFSDPKDIMKMMQNMKMNGSMPEAGNKMGNKNDSAKMNH